MTDLERRFGRFSVVGFMGAVLQLLLIALLTRCAGILHAAATPIAVEIAVLHNFAWHERFTWSDRGPAGVGSWGARLGRYHVGNGLVSLCGNTILMYYLVERRKAPALPIAIGSIVLCSLVNFWLAERWVYKNPRSCAAKSK